MLYYTQSITVGAVVSITIIIHFQLHCTVVPDHPEESWKQLAPVEAMLSFIGYKTSKGNERFYFIQAIQTDCISLGRLLGIEHETLEAFQRQLREDPVPVCTSILHTWITRAEGPYQITWSGLLDALHDARLGGIAMRLENALKYYYRNAS